MANYFIEFRFQGKAKRELRGLISDIDRKFRLGSLKNKRARHHITLVAPFKTRNQKRLVKDFKEVCQKYDRIKFKINGYGTFDPARVVYVNIDPSKKMVSFRNELLNRLKKYIRLGNTDIFRFLGVFKINKKYNTHSTIALKLNNDKFKRIKEYVSKRRNIAYDHVMIRATLIKEGKILYEYDFLQEKMLNRNQARSKGGLAKSIGLLREEHKKIHRR